MTQDLAPTGFVTNSNVILNDAATGSTVATLYPVDTGSKTGGLWVLDSQSQAGLFSLSSNTAAGSTATVLYNSGSLPAVGSSATLTATYYDQYQLNSDGTPMAGMGVTQTFTFTTEADSTKSLPGFGNNIAVYTGSVEPSAGLSSSSLSSPVKPVVTSLSNGDLVAVWTEASANATGDEIFGQLYTSTGATIGNTFQISQSATTSHVYVAPGVTALANGAFAVAYLDADPSFQNAAAIDYNVVSTSGSVSVGAVKTVAGATASDFNFIAPAITTLSTGQFIIGWETDPDQTTSVSSIDGQIYSASGSSSGSTIAISTGTGEYYAPSITALASGSYVAAWADQATGEVDQRVSTGSQSTISSGTSSSQAISANPVSIATLTNGNYVAVWNDVDFNTAISNIYGQIYNSSGVAQGSAFQIDTAPSGLADNPTVAALSTGGFVVTWKAFDDSSALTSLNNPTASTDGALDSTDPTAGDLGGSDGMGIFGRMYSVSGTTATALETTPFQVNQSRAGNQDSPDVVGTAGGGFAAVWIDNVDPEAPTAANVDLRILSVTPMIASAAYDAGTGKLTVTGANLTTSAADYTLADLTVSSTAGSFSLTSSDTISGTPTSTGFVVQLSAAGQSAVDARLASGGSPTLSASAGFDTGSGAASSGAIAVSDSDNGPSVSVSGGSVVSIASNQSTPVQIENGSVTVTGSPDVAGIYAGGTFTASISSNDDGSHDQLAIINTAGGITTSGAGAGSTVSDNGTSIGAIASTGAPGHALSVTLNSSATDAEIAALVKAIGISESGTTASTAQRQVTFSVTDEFGKSNAAATTAVDVIDHGAISGTAFNDSNGNGVKDAGDAGLSNVGVQLSSNGVVFATTNSDATGAYSFTGLTPGSYAIAFVTPAGEVADTTPGPVVVTGGQTSTVDAGFYAPSVISGTAFDDVNGDGAQEAGDWAIAGVTVSLLSSSNAVLLTTTTDGSGDYTFTGVAPGHYNVAVTPPPNNTATTPSTVSVTATSGSTSTADYGFYEPGTISGAVFNDGNNNGVQDTGETGVQGVSVSLSNNGHVILTTTTNANGAYQFTSLAPGSDSVAFTVSPGSAASTPTVVPETVTSGSSATVDAGFHVLPTVTSIDIAGASPNNADSDQFVVTFSDAVNGVDASDFVLSKSGTIGGSIESVSGSGVAWTVTVDNVTGDGTLGLDLVTTGDPITDDFGAALVAAHVGDQTYTIERTPPVVSQNHIGVSGATGLGGAFKVGDTITATWDNSGTGDHNADTINADGVTIDFSQFGGGSVAATDSGGVWSASYTIASGSIDTAAAHVVVTATDFVGNVTTTAGAAVTVDAVTPTVSSLTVGTSTGGTALDASKTATFTLTADEALTVDPAATLTLSNGATAIYASGTGTTAPTFVYTIASGDTNTTDLKVTGYNGSITDAAGNALVAAGVTEDTGIAIDTAAPAQPGAPALTAATDTGSSHTDGLTDDATPIVTGTAEAGSTVTLYDTVTAAVLGTGTATGGSYSITSSALSDGDYTLAVQARDAAGNLSPISPGLSVTIDTTAPAQPGAPTLTAATDTGSSATDGITSDTTPVVTGTAETGSTVTLYDTDGTTVLGTGVATGGTYSIASSTLSQGAHTLTVNATDAAGNVSAASSGLAVTIDTTAPAQPGAPTLTPATDTGPSPTDGITSDTTPVVTGSAEAGSNVTLYDTNGTTVLGTGVATGGTYSIASSALSQGAHTLTVKATDTAGNVSTASSGLSVTIDTTPPAQPGAPTLTAASDTGSSSTDGLTSDTTPIVTGTAEAGSMVTLYDTNGTAVLGAGVATGGTYSITSSALSQGAHTLTVKATDTAGNVSAASSGLAVTIDTTAPAQPGAPTLTAASDTGSSSTDGITSDTTPIVTGTAEAGSTVTLYDTDGTTVLGTGIAASGTYSIASSALNQGEHTLTVKATDVAGNVSTASSGLSVTIDATAPAQPGAPTLAPASDTGSSPTDGITSDTTPVVTGTAEAGSTVTLYDTDGTTVLGTGVAVGGTYSIASSTLGQGAHTLTVKAADAAGNVSVPSSGLAVAIDTTAPAQPGAPTLTAASDTGSSSTDGITSDTTPVVTGTAETGSTVTLYDTDGTTVLGTGIAASGTYSIASSALSQGAHTLTVKATDTAGNVSAASSGLAVTIDTTAPAQPGAPTLAAASDTGPSPTDGITSDTTPVVTGTAEAGSNVTLYDANGTTVLGTGVAINGTYIIASSTLGQGAHTLTVKATDTAGNVSAASSALSVTIDTTAPAQPGAPTLTAATDTGPSPTDGITSDTTPVVTGTAEAGSTVTLYDTDGTTVLGAGVATGGTYSITSSALSQGTHMLTVKATDLAGNVSTASSGLSVTVDTTAPAQPGAPTLTAASDTGSSSTDGITNDITPIVTGTAEAGSMVTLYDTDGTTVLGTGVATGGTYSITSSALSQGARMLTVKATDAAGNVSAASSGLAVTIDTTAPTLTITPVAGDNVVNAAEGAQPITVSGTAAGAEDGRTVTLALKSADGSATLDTLAATVANGAWNVTLPAGATPAFPDGTYLVTADVADAAGNPAPEAMETIRVDTTAPTLTINPIAGDNVVNAAEGARPITVSGTASGAEDGRTVTLALKSADGSKTLDTLAATVANGAWSVTLPAGATPAFPDGTYLVTADVADAAGNPAVEATDRITVDTTAPLAPSGLADASALGGVVNAARDTAAQTLTGSAEAGSTVTVFDGTTALGTTTASGAGAFSWTLGHLADGSHSLSATATDAAGNTGPASVALAIEVDATAPVVTITAPASGTTLSTLDTTLSGTVDAADAGSTVTLATGATALGTATVAADGSWSAPIALGTDGSYAITASDTDAAGNTGQAAIALTLNSTANESLFGSVTHDATGPAGDVYALYETILGRAPDPTGYESSLAALAAGASLTTLAQAMLDSPEYTADFGPLAQSSDSAFVDQLYENGLHRQAEPAALQSWDQAFGPPQNLTRAQVAVDIATSSESQAEIAPAFQAGVLVPNVTDSAIARLYYGLLDRAPDPAGLAFWEGAVAGGASLNAIAQNFLGSAEYQTTAVGQANTQYVEGLYQTALDRAPDPSGLSAWVTALDSGTASRADVANGFLASSEFQTRTAGDSTAQYVDEVYQAVLGASDPVGEQGWQMAIAGGLSRQTFDQAIVGSTQFQMNVTQPAQTAFVTALYQNALGRTPDTPGLQSFDTALSGGAALATVAFDITQSNEAAQNLYTKIEAGFHIA